MRHLRTSDGFTLAGILVSTAMTVGLSLIIAAVITNSQKAQQSIQNSADFLNLRVQIKQILEHQNLCNTAFKSTNINTLAHFANNNGPFPAETQLIGMISLGTEVVAQVGKNLGSGLFIESLGLRQVAPSVIIPAQAGGGFIQRVQLMITAKKSAGSLGGIEINTNRYPIVFNLRTNADGQIISCGTSNNLPFCELGKTIAATNDGSFACSDPVSIQGDPGQNGLQGPATPIRTRCGICVYLQLGRYSACTNGDVDMNSGGDVTSSSFLDAKDTGIRNRLIFKCVKY